MINNLTVIIVIFLFALLLLSCKEDELDSLALENMKKRVQATIDSADLIMKEKASWDSLRLIRDSLSLICDSSCEVRKAKFKRSTIEVILKHAAAAQGGSWYVYKTATGGFARYLSPKRRFEKTLSMEEWENLINILSKYCINWENEYSKTATMWVLEILYLNENKRIDTLKFRKFRGQSLPNWEKVEKAIFDVFEEKKGNTTHPPKGDTK